MNIRIASTAYSLPSAVKEISAVMLEENARIESALGPLSERLRRRSLEGLGMRQVRVCDERQPYDLAREAARLAITEAGVSASELDLIIDFVTLPGRDGQYLSFAQRLSCEFGAETSLNLSYRLGGCAGLHLALKNAVALMGADDSLRTALLVTADSPPAGNRSLLPVTIQGDAGSAVVLVRNGTKGPSILGTEVLTLGHLYDAITVTRSRDGAENLAIHVDSMRIEKDLMPIYYLNFLRLLNKVLTKASLETRDIDYFIYSNLSRTDREGFVRALGLPDHKVITTGLADLGHTFASDLVINYTDLRRSQPIEPGKFLVFASAGIGFTWGVTLARV